MSKLVLTLDGSMNDLYKQSLFSFNGCNGAQLLFEATN